MLLICLLKLTACNLFETNDQTNISGNIVFSDEDANGIHQIFTMDTDGSNLKQLTTNRRPSLQPSWSPDGRHIIFVTVFWESPIGPHTLWIMDADGSNQRPVTKNPNTGKSQIGNNPTWSPEGTKLAFDYCIGCEPAVFHHEVFITDLQTGTVDTLTNHPARDSSPVWSPDGSKIAFLSQRDYYDAESRRYRQDLYVADADGSNMQRLTEVGFVGSYIWIDSGTIIYMESDPNTIGKELFRLNIQTGEAESVMTLGSLHFGMFWDMANQQLLVLDKEFRKPVVTLQAFDLEGNLLEESVLNQKIKSIRGFDWKKN